LKTAGRQQFKKGGRGRCGGVDNGQRNQLKSEKGLRQGDAEGGREKRR